ncbi:MAG: YafY family transcriptional regulator [Anaerolineae bacterium]|nr:YafY family transcriptional regulator [Anaerolineae bacterium]
MRASRLLSILLLLQTRRRITAGELAQQLEVSERTVYRDMEALSAAGVPVYAERGHGGGWGLLDSYRTDLTGLNKDEVEALLLQQSSRTLSDLGLDKAFEAALIKLFAALPAIYRHDAEYVRQHIHVDGAGWFDHTEDVSHLSTLQDAIWQEHKLSISYQRSGGEAVSRLVDPLGLVIKGRIWYLIAAVEGALRTYRVSRVLDAQIVDQPCERPDDFDLAAYWQASVAQFKADLPQYVVTVRVAPWHVRHLREQRFVTIRQEHPPDEQGWVTLVVDMETEDSARQIVLGYGAEIELLEPLSLRQEVADTLKRAVELYAPA